MTAFLMHEGRIVVPLAVAVVAPGHSVPRLATINGERV